MLSLSSVITTLCPNYKLIQEKSEIKQQPIKLNDNIEFKCNSTYEQFLTCILHNIYENYNVQEHIDTINEFINTSTFVDSLNIKKIVSSIEQGIINNDVILFLSAYYDINIYVYHEEYKLIKVYYIEENLLFTKECCLITLTYDVYKTTRDNVTNENIDILLPNMMKIALGLILNKILIVGENVDLPIFTIDAPDEPGISNIVLFDSENILNQDKLLSTSIDEIDTFYNIVKDYVSKIKKIKIIKSK